MRRVINSHRRPACPIDINLNFELRTGGGPFPQAQPGPAFDSRRSTRSKLRLICFCTAFDSANRVAHGDVLLDKVSHFIGARNQGVSSSLLPP